MSKKEKIDIEKLLEETFEDSRTNISYSSLREFNEDKHQEDDEYDIIHTHFSEIIAEANIIKNFQGKNLSSPPCFRIKIGEEIIDFPKNWSYFKEWSKRVDQGEEDLCLYLNKKNDRECLIPILQKLAGGKWNELLFYSEEHIFYLFLLQNQNY